jgi:hypothetical protein
MQKWEYKTISCAATEKDLNELGAQGWELVAANDYYCFLKRPLNIATHY